MKKNHIVAVKRIKTNRIAIYIRVSTNDQTTLNQLPALIAYVKQRGDWQYEIFDETESSRKARPVKQQMMQRLRNGDFDAVLVWKMDRFARSFAELILDVKELLDKGIDFISLKENLDFNSAEGKLYFHILCAFSEFERDLIRSRTIEGLQRAKMEGKQGGRPKGSKDKKKRSTAGYILRSARDKQAADAAKGIHKQIKTYLQ